MEAKRDGSLAHHWQGQNDNPGLLIPGPGLFPLCSCDLYKVMMGVSEKRKVTFSISSQAHRKVTVTLKPPLCCVQTLSLGLALGRRFKGGPRSEGISGTDCRQAVALKVRKALPGIQGPAQLSLSCPWRLPSCSPNRRPTASHCSVQPPPSSLCFSCSSHLDCLSLFLFALPVLPGPSSQTLRRPPARPPAGPAASWPCAERCVKAN